MKYTQEKERMIENINVRKRGLGLNEGHGD